MKQVIKAYRISDINIDEVMVGPKKNNKKVPISMHNKPLVFQTPFLEITGPLRGTHMPNIFQLDTLFKGDNRQKIDQWYNFIQLLEDHVTVQAVNNGNDWFTDYDVSFKPIIREFESDKGQYIKWVIDLRSSQIIDENRNPFDENTLKSKDLIKLIVEISDLWINESQCGLVVAVQKIMVKPYHDKIISEYVFNDSESDAEASIEDEKQNNLISLLATEQKPKNKLSQSNLISPESSPKKSNAVVNAVVNGIGSEKNLKKSSIHQSQMKATHNQMKSTHGQVKATTQTNQSQPETRFKVPSGVLFDADIDELEQPKRITQKINNKRSQLSKKFIDDDGGISSDFGEDLRFD